MANGKMNLNILKWARAHDWGQQAELTADGRITGCREVWNDSEGNQYDSEAGPFDNLKELREWAGY